MKKQKTTITNKNSFACGDVYLLGVLKDGQKVYLSVPSWDCGWYWGFGYVQSRDFHLHFDSILEQNHIHRIGEWPDLAECVLNEREQWQLSELLAEAYRLKAAAALFEMGGANITGPTGHALRKDWADEINKKILPAIFADIDTLMTK